MVTLMPCSYISASRCGLIDKMIEPKVKKSKDSFFSPNKKINIENHLIIRKLCMMPIKSDFNG